MGTRIRADLSKDNQYYISKERRLELSHFCRQYDEWLKKIKELDELILHSSNKYLVGDEFNGPAFADPEGELSIKKRRYTRLVKMIDNAAGDVLV